MWTKNFQMFKLGLEKVEEPEIRLPTSFGSSEKQENSRKKKSISALLTMPKPLTVQITINCGKFLKRWEYQTTWLASSICTQVRKEQLELDMEQQTGSKYAKEYIKTIYCHPYAEYIMRNTGLDELQAEIKIAGRNINNLRYADDPYGRKIRKTKEPLDESERGEWKSWPKTQHSEN